MDSLNTHSKDQKYSYLEQSFEKGLQRSYERAGHNYRAFSPPQARSPCRRQSSSHRKSPRRSSEFSPYQDREQNMKDRLLMHQLKNHNRILSEQIAEYKIMVERLQVELRNKTDEFTGLDSMRQKQKHFYQGTVAEMKDQIKALLTKNTYLEQRSLVLEKEMKQFEEQFTRVQARNRSISASINTKKSQPSRLILELQAIFRGKEEQPRVRKNSRDAGKLLNQSYSLNCSYNPSPKNANTPKSGNKQNEEVILAQAQSLVFLDNL